MKNKRISKISIILIVVVVSLIIGSVIFLLRYANSPKQIVKYMLSNISDSLIEIVDKRSDISDRISKEKFQLQGNLDVSLEFPSQTKLMMEYLGLNPLINLINSANISVDLKTDIVGKKADAKFLFINGEKGNIDYQAICAQDGSAYYKIEDVTDKFIKYNENINIQDIFTANSDDNIKKVIKKLEKIVETNLKDEYFKKEKEQLNLEGKKVNTRKLILSLNSKQYKEYCKNILESIKQDTELVNYMVTMSNYKDSNKLLEKINLEIDRINSIEDNENEMLNISINKKLFKAKPIKYSIAKRKNETSENITNYIDILDYKTDKYDYKIKISEKSEVEVKKGEDNNITANFASVDGISGTFKGKIEKENIDLQYHINIKTSRNSQNITGILKAVEKDGKLNYSISYNVEQGINFKVEFDGIYEFNQDININIPSEYINKDKVNEDDFNKKLINKLNSIGLNEVIEMLEKITSSSKEIEEYNSFKKLPSINIK